MAKGKAVVEEKVASTVNTTVKRCTCAHAFQDRKYGKGRRVFNRTGGSGKGTVGWRCTVCKRQIG